MSTVTTTTIPSTLAYYGVGIIGLLSFTSFGMKKLFGCAWPWKSRRRGNDDGSSEVIDVLQERLSQKDAEIAELRKSLDNAEKKNSRNEEGLMSARKEIEHVNRRRTDLERQAKEALGQKETLKYELQARTEELDTSRDDTQRARERLEQTKTLLEARTSELKAAEAFLPSPDLYAGTDVMKMIEGLNSEIHQTASVMADVFSPDLQPPGPEREKDRGDSSSATDSDSDSEAGSHEAAAHTEEILGEYMTRMLQTFNHQEENILLQIAFQASMCAFTEWIMDSWCYHDRDSATELVLQETYEQLRETEEQTVSSRWRVLTRRYVRQIYPETDSHSSNLAYHILAACANILIIAGLRVPSSDSEKTVIDMLSARFSSSVALIVGRAVQLNNVIGDDVTSCELVPIYCSPGVSFDASTMENVSESGSENGNGNGNTHGNSSGEGEGGKAVYVKDDKILCTTDLGLLRAEKVQGEDGTWDNVILLKPKIVMASGLTASPTASEMPHSSWNTDADTDTDTA